MPAGVVVPAGSRSSVVRYVVQNDADHSFYDLLANSGEAPSYVIPYESLVVGVDVEKRKATLICNI